MHIAVWVGGLARRPDRTMIAIPSDSTDSCWYTSTDSSSNGTASTVGPVEITVQGPGEPVPDQHPDPPKPPRFRPPRPRRSFRPPAARLQFARRPVNRHPSARRAFRY